MLRKLPFSERILGKQRDSAHHEDEQVVSPPPPPQQQQHHGTPPPRRPEPQVSGGQALPFGWEVAVSRSTGEQYYVNTTTGESTFDLPEFTVGEQLEQCAPPFHACTCTTRCALPPLLPLLRLV